MGDLKYTQRARVVAVAVLAVAVAVIGFLLIGGDDDMGTPAPVVVSADQLESIAEDAEHPIYWAGERPGTKLEYERTEDGLIYIRYLSDDAEAGDPSTSFLTIGTYRTDDAITQLEAIAEGPNTARHSLPGGGLVVVNTEQPTSAYIAFRDGQVQVEVYDPDPATAIRLATSGNIVPLD